MFTVASNQIAVIDTQVQDYHVLEQAAQPELANLLQEIFILATGRAASADNITALQALLAEQGVQGIIDLVDAYMGQLSEQHGVVEMIKAVTKNGLGLDMTDEQVEALIPELQAQGIDTWSKLYARLITAEEAWSQPLNNRAEASSAFLDTLTEAGRDDWYAGNAVYQAVTALIQNIGSSDTSRNAVIEGLNKFAANLTETGIINKVADGYVAGATVFADANGNGQQDEGEWSTTTDAFGNYELPRDTQGMLIAQGGTDIMTNQPFKGVLTAPAGTTIINPLTTLVQSMLSSGQAATVEQAATAVQRGLGLSDTISVLTYDPIQRLAENRNDSDALAVQKAVAQVVNVLVQTSTVLSTAKGESDPLGSADAVLQSLSQSLLNASQGGTGALDLTDSDTLGQIIQNSSTASGLGETLSQEQTQQIAGITAASNSSAAASTTVTQLTQSMVVAQGEATEALAEGMQQGDFSQASEEFTGDNLDDKEADADTGYLVRSCRWKMSPSRSQSHSPNPSPSRSQSHSPNPSQRQRLRLRPTPRHPQ
ncbi:hypothetical protein [Magnetovirga frankeli]|uniref:hypothetical protein n=1 Tax=Magnetovirga frankeli TaxID=947516 RepID=UPI003D352069